MSVTEHVSRQGEASSCSHDWRRNPFVLLATTPRRFVIVCASCGLVSSTPATGSAPLVQDPADWPRLGA